MAQNEVPQHLGSPQVEIAVAQSQLLRSQLLVRAVGDEYWRGLGRRQLNDTLRLHLDFTGRHIRIHRFRWPRHDVALDCHNDLRADPASTLHRLVRQHVGIARDLHHALAITQVDEYQAAQIPTPVDPARQTDLAADMFGPQLARHMRAIRSAVQGSRHAVSQSLRVCRISPA